MVGHSAKNKEKKFIEEIKFTGSEKPNQYVKGFKNELYNIYFQGLIKLLKSFLANVPIF